jgi:hypothetical protein
MRFQHGTTDGYSSVVLLIGDVGACGLVFLVTDFSELLVGRCEPKDAPVLTEEGHGFVLRSC